MKKYIFLTALLIVSTLAQAQNSQLVVNNSSPCGVFVTMHAIEAGHPTACDIIANQFYVPPSGGSSIWGSFVSFQNISGPNWQSITPGSIPTTSTTFR